jgi:hypothetical protein
VRLGRWNSLLGLTSLSSSSEIAEDIFLDCKRAQKVSLKQKAKQIDHGTLSRGITGGVSDWYRSRLTDTEWETNWKNSQKSNLQLSLLWLASQHLSDAKKVFCLLYVKQNHIWARKCEEMRSVFMHLAFLENDPEQSRFSVQVASKIDAREESR